MDAAVIVGCALLGVFVGPLLLQLVVRVPAMATVGYVSEEEATISPVVRERAVRVLTPVLFATLLVVSVIDLEHYRIPDRIVFPALAVSFGLIVFSTLVEGFDLVFVRNAVLGSVAYFVLLLVPHVIYPKGMGFGDVKLALLMGMFLGWMYSDLFNGIALIMWALVIGSLLGVVAGIAFALLRGRRAEFPFGPALALGCVLVILFSDSFVP